MAGSLGAIGGGGGSYDFGETSSADGRSGSIYGSTNKITFGAPTSNTPVYVLAGGIVLYVLYKMYGKGK